MNENKLFLFYYLREMEYILYKSVFNEGNK